MCEVAIRVLDKTEPNHPLRAFRSQRGDVIDVRPDGWRWTQRELTSPAWRFVRLPGLPESALADLTQEVRDRDGKLVQRRGRGIDLSTIAAVEAKWTVGAVCELQSADRTKLLAARKDKPSPQAVID